MSSQSQHTDDIHRLVAKMLLGQLTAEEQSQLQTRLDASPRLRKEVEEIMNEDRLVERYRQYSSIDADKAKHEFMARHGGNSKQKSSFAVLLHSTAVRWISAAAVICLVVISTRMLLSKSDTAPQPTVLTPEIAQSIDRMEQSGNSGATLTVGNKNVTVSNAKMAQTKAAQDEEEASDGLAGLFSGSSDDVSEGALVTQRNKEFWMVLDDGTYVHLNHGSRLTYPVRFVERERSVTLTGEAYFIVAKDQRSRPFVVHTPNGDVRDYGTEFNVNTKAGRGSTAVVLVSGKVGVTCRGGAEVRLRPGEMAVMSREPVPEVSKVDVTPYVSWNTGNFHFDGISLQELMQVIAHWYSMDVEYASDEVRAIRFTGTLEKYETLGNTLRAIENVISRNITTDNGKIVVGNEKQK